MALISKIQPYKIKNHPTQAEIENDFATSARTSIYRKTPAAPLKVLLAGGYIRPGNSLNFGKGKYDTDSLSITEVSGSCHNYDYTHCNVSYEKGTYLNLYSGFVVNTLQPISRDLVWIEMSEAISSDGVAFVAARSDKIKGTPFEDGYISSVGTFQRRYVGQDLANEAKKYFKFVEFIKGKSGFHLVRCSHSPLQKIEQIQGEM